MRIKLTREEILEICKKEGISIQEDLPIYMTDDVIDLIEGLEVDSKKEVTRYAIVGPDTFVPPLRDKKVIVEDLIIDGENENEIVDRVYIFYEVIRDKETNEKTNNILLAKIKPEVLTALKDADDLIRPDRDLIKILESQDSLKEDLLFGINVPNIFNNLDDEDFSEYNCDDWGVSATSENKTGETEEDSKDNCTGDSIEDNRGGGK